MRTERPRLINVGGGGLAGHYTAMLGKLRLQTPKIIVFLVALYWYFQAPFGPVTYRLSPAVSLDGVIRLGFLVTGVRLAWPLVVAVWHGLLWLNLERIGLIWVQRNDQMFRVALRRADGKEQIDESTQDDRLKEEENNARFRRQRLGRDSVRFGASVLAYLLLPLATFYLFDLIRPKWAGRLHSYHFQQVVEWLLLTFAMLPYLFNVIWDLFDYAVYASGAQYIASPRVMEAPRPAKTIETIRDEMSHGTAKFLDPDEVARRMSS